MQTDWDIVYRRVTDALCSLRRECALGQFPSTAASDLYAIQQMAQRNRQARPVERRAANADIGPGNTLMHRGVKR